MENFLLIFLIIVGGLLILFITSSKKQYQEKPKQIKKQEIIDAYKQQLLDIRKTYHKDEQTYKEQKMIFIKEVNKELNKNIFFDQDEIANIIKELALI
jgi:predicted PurR-regulated permease PerM